MKYTRSKDGESRATLIVKKRVTREERRELVELARRQEQSLKEFLWHALERGIALEYELYGEEAE